MFEGGWQRQGQWNCRDLSTICRDPVSIGLSNAIGDSQRRDMSGGGGKCRMKSLDARMGSIDGQLAFPGFDSNRCNLRGASMNVYHKGRGREHFRKGHLRVEQFVESALSEEPEVGGCESSTENIRAGSSRRMLSSSTGFCAKRKPADVCLSVRDRGIVIAPRQGLVGTSSVYAQLLIHARRMRRSSGTFDHVTPA